MRLRNLIVLAALVIAAALLSPHTGGLSWILPVFGITLWQENSEIYRQLRSWGLLDTAGNLRAQIGQGGLFGAVISLLDSQTSLAGVGNAADATDDTLFTKTILGNTLTQAGSAIRIRAQGVTAANGNNKRVTLVFGGTTLVTSGTITSNGLAWVAEAIIYRTGAATQVAVATFMVSGGTMVLTKSAPTETLSGSVAAKVTGASQTSSAANDVLGHGWTVEAMPISAP